MGLEALLNLENPVFTGYLFWSSILAIKMLIMSPLTGVQRFKNKAFANPEDLPSPKIKVKLDDPNVERVRRAHRNDLENITVFFVVGLIYVLTNPAPVVAINLYRAIAIARIAHTLVYAVVVIPQPARGLAWAVGYFATAYMAVASALHFL